MAFVWVSIVMSAPWVGSRARRRFRDRAADGDAQLAFLPPSFHPATQFIATEDLNFSIYNYLNELTQETAKLEEQTAEIHQEIDRYQGRANPLALKP